GDHAFHRNLHQAQTRSGFAAFLLWFFLGSFGAHLMYLRRWTMLIFHYVLAIFTVVAFVMVFRNNNIHSLGVGLAALWMACVPVGIYNFGS
ncbi:NINE protein, partial [Brevibacterium sp. SIMBA_078]|uniref:NINE protein n=2 Tax=Bacteria TaxID=2 RepID=UPI00397A2C7D